METILVLNNDNCSYYVYEKTIEIVVQVKYLWIFVIN